MTVWAIAPPASYDMISTSRSAEASTTMPVSSNSSRAQASTGRSPSSTCPPGMNHPPPANPAAPRFITSISPPRQRTTEAESSNFGMGGLYGSPHKAARGHVAARPSAEPYWKWKWPACRTVARSGVRAAQAARRRAAPPTVGSSGGRTGSPRPSGTHRRQPCLQAHGLRRPRSHQPPGATGRWLSVSEPGCGIRCRRRRSGA